jgi:hypothetical protein
MQMRASGGKQGQIAPQKMDLADEAKGAVTKKYKEILSSELDKSEASP